MLPIPLDAPEILNREYLEIRALLLQAAAKLDRLDRAAGDVSADPRRQQIHKGIAVLQGANPDRAEKIQLLFSLPYLENWKMEFGIPASI
ncbi:MAG TPA: hypothetical protein VFE24_03115 [Pirellulales bacterium]|nr:hypothetical protein [Pirellulales bacterium]